MPTVHYVGGPKHGTTEMVEGPMTRSRKIAVVEMPWDPDRDRASFSESDTIEPIMYETAEYRLWNIRTLHGCRVYEFKYVSPVPKLRAALRRAERRAADAERRLLDLLHGPEYRNDAFDDGLGGW